MSGVVNTYEAETNVNVERLSAEPQGLRTRLPPEHFETLMTSRTSALEACSASAVTANQLVPHSPEVLRFAPAQD